MGNTMPCLVVQGTKTTLAVPAMEPGKRVYSLQLLMQALHKVKKRAKNVAGGSPSSEAAEGGGAGGGGGGGEVKGVVNDVKLRFAKASSPRRAAACHGRHGGGGGGCGHRKGVVRVKVVLTKEEAARLLSLTVDGRKTAAQIVAEIKRMEARRAAATTAWRPALASIPEESW